MLSAEIVKTFYQFKTVRKEAEPTVQQEETPQPPPPKPPEGIEEDGLLPDPDEQQKDEISFFTLPESHLGHFVPLTPLVMLCRTENLSLQFMQSYSYIGIFPPENEIFRY